jgi:hypothetical protein
MTTPILNRQQLSQFLPSPEAIKAFESLFKYVSQTAPAVADDISILVASIRNPNSAFKIYADRLDLIEQQQRKLNSSNSDILNRIEVLEQIVSKKSNGEDFAKRLQSLESIIGV